MRWTLLACVAIVAFDLITAVADRTLGYDYNGVLSLVVSTAIYAFPALKLAREGHDLRAAALAGAVVAMVDSTIGWAVATVIGPGAPPPGSHPAVIVLTAITVTGIGALIGLVAGLAARRLSRPA